MVIQVVGVESRPIAVDESAPHARGRILSAQAERIPIREAVIVIAVIGRKKAVVSLHGSP